MDKLIGKMLDGRYEILDVLGYGGMAIVYRARCHRLNRLVALKILKDEFLSDEEFKNRFQDESLSVAMLSHPNIVAVYDVSRSDDIEYIVMELIDGITLKEFLTKKAPLTWQETTFFALQIAKALEHAHNRGVIHRDIKPQNIMILRDGTAKVADFGIAHQMAKQQTFTSGEAIGSVHYISPEQAKGSRVDNRTDIYSLGVVMYEMLTNRLPFEGNTPIEIALQHINSVPLLPSDHVPTIPKAIENVTMKAMNPDRTARYSSAEEMIEDLNKIRNNPNVKIDIVQPSEIMPQEDDVGATRKLTYDSEMEKIKPAVKNGAQQINDGRHSNAPSQTKPRSPVTFAVVSVLVFIIGAVYFAFSILNPFGNKDKNLIKVPTLEGEMFSIVEMDTQYDNFKISVEEKIYNDEVEEGRIISQTPQAGRTYNEGDEIKVVVSRGKKTTQMPDFSGVEYRQVEIEIDRMGMVYTEVWEFSNTVARNLVIDTTPGKGETISENEEVSVRISKGKEMKEVAVPDLIGKTEEDAKNAIVNAGLSVGDITKVDSDKKDGTVVFQTIPQGSKIQEGTKIDFQISKEIIIKQVAKIIKIPLVKVEGAFDVAVYINDVAVYEKQHLTEEGIVEVPVVANEGKNMVKIVQNGAITLEQEMDF